MTGMGDAYERADRFERAFRTPGFAKTVATASEFDRAMRQITETLSATHEGLAERAFRAGIATGERP